MYSFVKMKKSNVKSYPKPTSVCSDKDLYSGIKAKTGIQANIGIKANKDFGLQNLKAMTKTKSLSEKRC